MPMKQRFDRLLLGATVVQASIGLAVMASASWAIATVRYHRPGAHFLSLQLVAALIGLVAMVICMHLRLELVTDQRVAAAAVGLSGLLLIGALMQPPVANAHRWLSIGGLSIQASVAARLAMILLAAAVLPAVAENGWRLRRFAPVCLTAAAVSVLIVAEPDLGSAVLLLGVLVAMAFVAGMPLRLMAIASAAAATALPLAILASPYRLARVKAFLDPDTATAAAWQTRQSLIALGSGGWFGRGYGAGMQKLFFLPEPHTDFVYAITGEELGLLGVLALLLLVVMITWRGLRISWLQAQPQRALLAFGLTVAFASQALLHIAVCCGLLPPKGIPLPLVSYGKTDLVVSLVSLGLLLNLSREVSA